MRTIVVSILAATVLAIPALAQQASVTDRDCRQLVEYQASQDVTYKPGVDSRGRAVAPADLPASGTPIQPPSSFTIDMKTSLAGKFGIPANSPLFEPSVDLGKITVEDGGRRVLYNGQALGSSERNGLAELCKQRQAQPPQNRPMTGPMKLN